MAILVVAQDVTERKQAEERLRQSEAKYRSLIEGATYGIYSATLTGRFLDANPALVKMLGRGNKLTPTGEHATDEQQRSSGAPSVMLGAPQLQCLAEVVGRHCIRALCD